MIYYSKDMLKKDSLSLLMIIITLPISNSIGCWEIEKINLSKKVHNDFSVKKFLICDSIVHIEENIYLLTLCLFSRSKKIVAYKFGNLKQGIFPLYLGQRSFLNWRNKFCISDFFSLNSPASFGGLLVSTLPLKIKLAKT